MFEGTRWTGPMLGVGALSLVLLSAPLAAQAPAAGAYSPAVHSVDEYRGVLVEMRDGVELSVDVYRPAVDETVPVIVMITPYDNTGPRNGARDFAQRGYAVVVADSRGRYDSKGDWDPFDSNHKTDGYDLVEWAAAEEWSTGRIGMFGGSYLGWTQWWTATTTPPSLAAIVPMVAPPDGFYNTPYQHGAIMGSYMLDWASMMSGRTMQTRDSGAYGGWRRAGEASYPTPYMDINETRGLRSSPWFSDWYLQNRSTDPYWAGIAYQGPGNWSQVTVPSLAVSGWFDTNHPGTPMNYLGMKEYGATPESRRPAMIIGPWVHSTNQQVVGGVDYGADARIDMQGYVTRWFDHWLKGIDNGVERDPPVHVFVMGENAWYAEADWPLPQTDFTRFYLTSGGNANSLKGDGVLTTDAPAQAGLDAYTYDPHRPTRDAFVDWPDHNGHIDGALDTRLSALGDEVLVYQTPPLDEPLEVTGPIEAKLYASTSARDTDWMVRLVDVHPDGHSALLAEGVIRAMNRDPADEGRFNPAEFTTIEPNRVYEYTIEFWRGTANLFQRGHRIRIEISSSWTPYYLPNLNTGLENAAAATIDQAVIAEQRVHHGGDRASYVVLPVIHRNRPATDDDSGQNPIH